MKSWTHTAKIGNKLKWIYCKRQRKGRRGKKATFTDSCDFFFVFNCNARVVYFRITRVTLWPVCWCVGAMLSYFSRRLMNYWYTFIPAQKSRLCLFFCWRSYQPKYNLHIDYITVECGWYVEMWSKEIHTKRAFMYIIKLIYSGKFRLAFSRWCRLFVVGKYRLFCASYSSGVNSAAKITVRFAIKLNYITDQWISFHFFYFIRCAALISITFFLFCKTLLTSVSYWLIRRQLCKFAF